MTLPNNIITSLSQIARTSDLSVIYDLLGSQLHYNFWTPSTIRTYRSSFISSNLRTWCTHAQNFWPSTCLLTFSLLQCIKVRTYVPPRFSNVLILTPFSLIYLTLAFNNQKHQKYFIFTCFILFILNKKIKNIFLSKLISFLK